MTPNSELDALRERAILSAVASFPMLVRGHAQVRWPLAHGASARG